MCKKNVLTIVTVAMAIVGLTAASANARIIVEEQFIYEPPEANIDGQNGGTGFDGPWVSTISHGRIYWIVSPGLSFSTLPVAGNALSRYGSMGGPKHTERFPQRRRPLLRAAARRYGLANSLRDLPTIEMRCSFSERSRWLIHLAISSPLPVMVLGFR